MPNQFFRDLLRRNENRINKKPFLRQLSDHVLNSGTARGGETIYHGTYVRNIDRIHDKGFRKSLQSWYGQGVYGSHDYNTAKTFGTVMRGELPPGFKYKTLPPNVTTREALRIAGQKPLSGTHTVKSAKWFDVSNDLSKTFEGYHGVRVPGWQEPQLLIFDEGIANTVFNTDGPKAGPSTPLSKKPPTRTQALNKGLSGLASYGGGGLSSYFAAAELGNQLAEMTELLSENLFGPLDPKKKNTTEDKIK